MKLLDNGDPHPVITARMDGASRFLLVCDHAGREVPRALSGLGLPQEAFERHIAWDIGAAGLTRRLSAALDAPCILQRYSRLVIDCNRDPARPDAIPEMSDGALIPGNQSLDAEARAARVAAIHTPYHAAIAAALDRRQGRSAPTILVFVHSFTPRLSGAEADRPWRFGVLREATSRFSEVVLKDLRALKGEAVGDNQPYAMDEVDYSAPTHALARGLDYLELETRQDLIADEQGQAAVTEMLIGVLTGAADRA